ncbi:hypothetical protein TNIN_411651 [Trichonephila inaurata madagascariensis]|uniref:Uncharacterized protein n=1 Tax=Trichonephila inaurata madagascariensis TaxID=2747483 RepID=A0A8X6M8A6_9ARAC|nr:hypothetical protein TNIN_411651 [Trichonephila inaurata madagascariensis]
MQGRAVATYQIYISNHQQRKFVGEVLRDKTLEGLKKALFRRERDNKDIIYKTEGRKLVLWCSVTEEFNFAPEDLIHILINKVKKKSVSGNGGVEK